MGARLPFWWLLAAVLLLLMTKHAGAQTTATVGPVVWVTYQGTAQTLPRTSYATLDKCIEHAKAKGVAIKYTCRTTVSVTVVLPPPPPPPPPPEPTIAWPLPAPQGAWTKVADQGGSFTVATVTTVRFGPATNYQYRNLKGSYRCTSDSMQWWDASPGRCEAFTFSGPSNIVQHVGGGPKIDIARIPVGAAGSADLRVRSTAEMPSPSDGTGAFRTTCEYSHMAFDDPIVKPGDRGGSHLHTFFGNTGVNADSTAESIVGTGSSTCRGGIANRSSYWIPSLIDIRTGVPLAPQGANFYYKTGYNNIGPANIKPFPAGLRMVAGNMRNVSAAGAAGTWECVGGGESLGRKAAVVNCPAGSTLVYSLYFPQCWDGANLDAPDHRSHMAYPTSGGKCPSTHPVPLTEISYHIGWKVFEAGAPLHWRFSSDAYDPALPGGYSGHGDWFFGWRQPELQLWVTQCNQAAKDCHSHLLGGGREIY